MSRLCRFVTHEWGGSGERETAHIRDEDPSVPVVSAMNDANEFRSKGSDRRARVGRASVPRSHQPLESGRVPDGTVPNDVAQRDATGRRDVVLVLPNRPLSTDLHLSARTPTARPGHSHVSVIRVDDPGVSQLVDAVLMTPPLAEFILGDPNSIRTFVAIADAREGYRNGHSERIRAYAAAAARELVLPDRQVAILEVAALLHDIGCIGVPESILSKPEPLTSEEWRVIRNHPLLGISIVRHAPQMEAVVPIILQHHERYDGQGYPNRLRGTDTHVLAQILAIAESYEAMTRQRPYRRALTHEEAIAELHRGAGTQYHPMIVEVFIKAAKDTKEQTPDDGEES